MPDDGPYPIDPRITEYPEFDPDAVLLADAIESVVDAYSHLDGQAIAEVLDAISYRVFTRWLDEQRDQRNA